jgi:hypothetical protein
MNKDKEYVFDTQYLDKLYSENPNPKITEVLKAVEQGSYSWKAQLKMLKMLLSSYKDELLDIKRIKIENPNLNLLDTDNDRWYNWLKNDCKKKGIEYKESREDYEKEFRKHCYEEGIDYDSECKSDFEFITELFEYEIECIDNEIKKIETLYLTETGSEQEVTPETATQPEKVILKRGRPKVREYEQKIIAFEVLETAIKTRIEKNYPVRSLTNYCTLLKYCKRYFKKGLSELTIDDIEQERAKSKKKAKSKNNKK